MIVPRGAIWLSIAAALFMAVASFAGIFSNAAYAAEAPAWAAEGTGQDWVNLFLVVPAIVILALLSAREHIAPVLLWMGLLIYATYSYFLYSGFVTFGPLFPIYVVALGTSFYAFFWSAIAMLNTAPPLAVGSGVRKAAAIYLGIVGLLFGLRWLSEIAGALASGNRLASAVQHGLKVNPVHVLDLAFILPAMLAVSYLLLCNRQAGILFAVPLMTFAAVMGSAIIAMVAVTLYRGLPGSWAPAILMAINIAIAAVIGGVFLKRLSKA